MNSKRIIIWSLVGLMAFSIFFWGIRNHNSLESNLPPRIPVASFEAAMFLTDGKGLPIAGTGSMHPYIPRADTVNPYETVVAVADIDFSVPFEEIKKGDLVLYRRNDVVGYSILHVAAYLDEDGWVMTGLANKRYETETRVTKSNYRGVARKIFLFPYK